MAHHAHTPFGDFPNQMDEFKKNMPAEQANRINDLLMQEKKNDFGATKNFPDGKLTESDDGEIKFGITHVEDRVILNFATPVNWIGFTKEQAQAVAASLIKHSLAE